MSGSRERKREHGRMLASALERSTKTPAERGRTPSPHESDYGSGELLSREVRHFPEPMLHASVQARERIDLESIQLSINQIRQSQEEHMFSLRSFMAIEFQGVKASLPTANQHDPHPQQAQTSIANSFVGLKEEDLRNILEDVLSKVRVTPPQAVSDNVEAGVPVARSEDAEVKRGTSRGDGRGPVVCPDGSKSFRKQRSPEDNLFIDCLPSGNLIDAPIGRAFTLNTDPPGSKTNTSAGGSTVSADALDDDAVRGLQSLTTGHTSPMMWRDFQEAVEGFDPCSVYKRVLERKIEQRSFWHGFLERFGLGDIVLRRHPRNWGARFVEHISFTVFQTLLILINTALMAFESDEAMQAITIFPHGETTSWVKTTNMVFNVIFGVELLFRMVSLGTWFFVAPNEWGWNVFDFGVVTSSIAFDLFNAGVSFTYVRTLRIIRVFRIARIIRVLRFFRQLRQMLYSIIACLASLAWAFLFLSLTIFMFSMVCMEGVITVLEDIHIHQKSQDNPFSIDMGLLQKLIYHHFGTLPDAMISVLAAVTGGLDWLEIYNVLSEAGALYSVMFVFYVLFVIVGVMNVLTGVFLTSANEFVDVDLIVQGQQMRIEAFCEQMISLFYEFDSDRTGKVDWDHFSKALARQDMQAYLGSLGLEPTHIRLIFELLDRDMSGEINLEEFVMGLVKLKGEAKAIDARIIQREIGMIPLLLKHVLNKFARDNGWNEMVRADGTVI